MPQYGHDGRRTPHTQTRQCPVLHPEHKVRCQRNVGHPPNHTAEMQQEYLDADSQRIEPRAVSWWLV
jgi:hypothetical protein